VDEKSIGHRIKHLRDRKAWTQEHLATAAQLSVRTIQRAEEGVLSAETLSAIAGALAVTVEDISSPKNDYPRLSAILFYESAATLDWLVKAFGFEIQMKYVGPDGRIQHAELGIDGAKIMVGAPQGRWCTPKALKGSVTHNLYVMVDDVDAHYARAKKAGAKILSKPENAHGHRRYEVEDPEGHPWYFVHPLKP
jgi:uncharacterized glyoxalase superfamily protein PhnB/DNA-binding XRE family transcriptional regulator